MSATTSGRRLMLKLDAAMPFEALILNRLSQLPLTRRQDWVRSLLIEGFKQECRALRKVKREPIADAQGSRQEKRNIVAPPAVRDTHRAVPVAPDATPSHRIAESSAAGARTVTLATLRRVIG